MKKVLLSLMCIQISLGGFSQIIADHTVVEKFNYIPQYYIDEVKKMLVAFYGESHSVAYYRGLELLEEFDGTYACNVSTGEDYTESYLRAERNGYMGEDIWFTWYAFPVESRPDEATIIKSDITSYNSEGHPYSAIGFGWCNDMTGNENGYSTIDPDLGVHWYGRSDGGPDGSIYWGIDEDDKPLTGNSVSLNTYFEAMEEYIVHCATYSPSTKVIFTTGPVDAFYGSFTGEQGFQGHLKHEAIRAYVMADPGKVLFDYADILSYDNDGTPSTQTWNGHTFPIITPANEGDQSIGHISPAGAIRLAKAQWWMLARIAGWDGYPVTTWTGGVPGNEYDWNTAGNWSGGEVPTENVNVIIPLGVYLPVISSTGQADCHNLEIQTGATLTIESDGSGTGSLIVTGSSTGSVTCKRQLRTETNNGDYHYFSSPVVSNSETNSTKVITAWQWNEVAGGWTTLAMTALQSGRGYNLDQTTGSDGLITLTGTLVTSDFTIDATSPYSDITDGTVADYLAGRDIADGTGHSGTARSADDQGYGGGGWNMLGNPYTSAINALSFINYKRNLDNLEPSYQAVFLYDGDSPGHARYYYMGNPTGWEDDILLGQTHIQVGQGFFVLAMNDTSTFTFTRAMQEHNTGAVYLKSPGAGGRWPGLRLKVQSGADENSTTIVFKNGMSPGLDPGYDVGVIGFSPGAGIYTALLEDNGINFSRQALPQKGINRRVVPVGIDFENGGEVTFSADIEPPGGNRFILEDRTTGILTDLGTGCYTVILPENTFGQGRFFIHIADESGRRQHPESLNLPDLRIWSGRNNRVNIQGAVSDGATCQVYDLQGHKVFETRLSGTDFNTFTVSPEVRGVYLVKVTDGEKVRTQKVIFN